MSSEAEFEKLPLPLAYSYVFERSSRRHNTFLIVKLAMVRNSLSFPFCCPLNCLLTYSFSEQSYCLFILPDPSPVRETREFCEMRDTDHSSILFLILAQLITSFLFACFPLTSKQEFNRIIACTLATPKSSLDPIFSRSLPSSSSPHSPPPNPLNTTTVLPLFSFSLFAHRFRVKESQVCTLSSPIYSLFLPPISSFPFRGPVLPPSTPVPRDRIALNSMAVVTTHF